MNNDYEDYPMRIVMPPEFPFLLRQIADPPKKLWVKGDFKWEWKESELPKFLCVIGSRRYSGYGKEACEMLIGGLTGYPIVIVSGLAIGMDAIAHKAALNSGLLTIAVPGSGLHSDVLYPRSHIALARRILEAGGALMSELEPETHAARWTFPRRNRIMAGLSHATLVIEASARSGTLITSRLALDYNRDVFAVPGSIFSEHTSGVHGLVGQGARLITSSRDILEALGLAESPDEDAPPVQARMENLFSEKNADWPGSTIPAKFGNCSKEELALLDLLSEPLSRDKLIEKSGFSAGEINALIGRLELKGFVKERAGEFSIV